jgi:REP element-mobilizing transposase RayT
LAGVGGSFRAYKHFAKLEGILKAVAVNYGVRVEERSWNGDHAHFIIRIHNRQLYKAFIRVLTARIVFVVTEGRNRLKNGMKLWKFRPFTRVIRGFRAHKTAIAYVRLNQLEAEGKIQYRKERLRGLEPDEIALVWT